MNTHTHTHTHTRSMVYIKNEIMWFAENGVENHDVEIDKSSSKSQIFPENH
jgi:hypothetical protein